MLSYVVILCSFVAVSLAVIGPHGPIIDVSEGCAREGNMVADRENMCFYHLCLRGADGLYYLPRRCALGTKVDYGFIQGLHNPCTVNFNGVNGYDCHRHQPSEDIVPECAHNTVCHNGGYAVYEADRCWCICPETWQGDNDCSKPTRDVTGLPPNSNICVNGKPQKDWCAEAGGCLSDGVCYNQCDSFWCDCPDHLHNTYNGKRCERYHSGNDYK